MSHTASISGIKIVDIAALQSAIAELATGGIKISLQTGGTPRAYFNNQKGMGVADYVIKLADAPYDIGLYKQPDGSYEPRTDFFQSHVEKILGAQCSMKGKEDQAKLGKLFQMYGIHATTLAARKTGKTVRRITGKDGAVQLEVMGY